MANIPFLNNAYFAAKVAIGTETSYTIGGAAQVTIATGSAETALSFGPSNNDMFYMRNAGSQGNFQFQTSVNGGNSGSIQLQPFGGNVGIGTTSPTDKLDIAGAARFTSNISFSSSKAGRIYKASNHGLAIHGVTGTENDFAMFTPVGALKIIVPTGTNNVVINPTNGLVGIGTTSPSEKLQVEGKVYVQGNGQNWNETTPGITRGSVHFDPGTNVANTGNALTFGASDTPGSPNEGSTAQAGIYTRSDGTYGTKMYFATTDSYASGSKTAMMIDYNANVGIGTTSPALQSAGTGLHINATTSSELKFTNNTTGVTASDGTALVSNSNNFIINNREAGNITLGTSNSTRMTILSGGNVGIGTTSPGSKLEVSGGFTQSISPGSIANSIRMGVNTTNGLQFANRFYNSISGTISTGVWIPIVVVGDSSTFRCTLSTAAHSNVTFIASRGYGPSNRAHLQILDWTYNPNGGYANVSGLRIRQSGQVEMQMTFSSGPIVSVNVVINGFGASIVSSLAETTSTESIIDTVLYQNDGMMRTRGGLQINNTPALASAATRFLVPDTTSTATNLVKSRTAAQVLSDIGAAPATGGAYLPLAGGTLTGDLNIHEASSPTLSIKDTTNNVNLLVYSQNSDSHIGTYSSHPLIFDTNSSERMRIDGSGNIMIGNTNAGAKLDVRADTGYAFRTENASGYTFRIEASTGNVYTTGDLYVEDNNKIRLGASGDLQIYHDGSNSFIDNGTGNLTIDSGVHLLLKTATGESLANFFANGANELFYDNSKKLSTGSVGVGTATTAGGTLIDGWKTTTQANAINDTTIATTAYVNNKIALIPAGLVFQGTWNAATNTPTLTSGSGTTGHFYIVSVAGSTNLDGITDWKVGDWAVFIEQGASDQWEKIDNSSVLDGVGTGQSVTKWDGSGTSNTLTNGPITFSTNDSTFAGNVALGDGKLLKFGASDDFQIYHNSTTNVNHIFSNLDRQLFLNAGIIQLTNQANTTTYLKLESSGATFAGNVITPNVFTQNLYITSSGTTATNRIDNDGSQLYLTYGGTSNRALEISNSNGNATFAGDIMPAAENLYDIGSASVRWEDIYGDQVYGRDVYVDTKIIHNGDINNFISFAASRMILQSKASGAKIDLHDNGSLFLNSGGGTTLTLDTSQNATFTGDITLGDNKVVEWGNGNQQILGNNTSGLALYSNGERMRILTNGNVGIGTTNPQAKLEIGSTSGAASGQYNSPSALLISTSGGSAGAGGTLLFGADGSSASDIQWSISNSNSGSNATGSIGNLNFNTKQTLAGTVLSPAMTIKSGGNVGIGVTNPTDKLTVNGNLSIFGNKIYNGSASNSAGVSFPSSTTRIDGFNGITFHSSATTVGSQTERMRIASNGNVGIGTTSPSEKLQVLGKILSQDGSVFSQFNASGQDTIISNSGSGSIRLFNAGSEKMRIDSAGNVAIGRTAASKRLDINLSAASGEGASIILRNTTAGSGAYNRIYFAPTASDPNIRSAIIEGQNTDGNNNMALIFKTSAGNNPTEKMRISQTGAIKFNTYGAGTLVTDANGNITVSSGGGAGGPYLPLAGGTMNSGAAITFIVPSAGGNFININHTGNENWSFGAQSGTGADDYIDIGINGGTRAMSWHETGNVGIGTTNPQRNLTIYASSGNAVLQLANNTSGVGASDGFLAFTDGTNVGLENKENGYLSLATNASEKMRINSSGNVGIGTTSIGTNDKLLIKTSVDNSVAQGLVIQRSANADEGYINYNGGGFQFRSTDGDPIVFGQVSNERVRISDSGNVGIGTTSPSSFNSRGRNLVVNSDGDTGITISANSTSSSTLLFADAFAGTGGTAAYRGIIEYDHANDSMAFSTSATERMRITSAGNVGIGTTAPSTRLDVGGNLQISDNKINANNKTNRIKAQHYTNAEQPVTFMFLNNFSTSNTMFIGGGSTVENSVTSMQFYTAANNTTTQGSERMRITSGGNVGIGTTNPLNKLTVQVSNTGTQVTTIPVGKFINTGNAFSKLILGSNNANFDGVVSMDNDSTLANTKLRIYIGNGTTATTGHSNDHIVLQGNGNVGIGTINPSTKLDVAGLLRIAESGNTAFYGGDYVRLFGTQAFRFLNSGGSAIAQISLTGNSYFNGGNVGIGNTNPQQKLHIVSTDGANIILNSNTAAENNGVFMTEGAVATPYVNGAYVHYDSTNNEFKINTGAASLATRFTIARDTGAIKFNTYNGTNNTGSPTHILGTDANGLVVKSTAGSSIGPWLPLAAGSGDPLTGDLFYNGSIRSTTPAGKLILNNSSTTTELHAAGAGGIVFKDSGNNTKAVINSSGNVGIGTTSPASKLMLQQDSGGATVLRLKNLDNLTSAGAVQNSIIMNGRYWSGDANSVIVETRINSVHQLSDGNGGSALTFETQTGGSGTTEKVRIDRDGNVGIGITNPTNKLDIEGVFGVKRVGVAATSTIDMGGNFNFNAFDGYSHVFKQSGTERVRILPNGNVGIGKTNPAVPLDVEGKIRSNDSNSADYLEIFCDGSVSGDSILKNTNSSIVLMSANGITKIKTGDSTNFPNASLEVFSSSTAKIKLNSSGNSYFNGGNVGIGTTSPSTQLEIFNNNDQTCELRLGTSSTDGGNVGHEIQFQAEAGSAGVQGRIKTILTEDDNLDIQIINDTSTTPTVTFFANKTVGIGRSSNAYQLGIKSTSNGSIFADGRIITATNLTGSTGNILGALKVGGSLAANSNTKLDVNGKVLIKEGTGVGDLYLGNYATANHFRFHTNNANTFFDMNCGDIYWRQGSSTRYRFFPSTANMTINGTLTQNSDARVKENVIEIGDCINKVKAMRGVYYNRTDFNTEVTKVGVIAQEVEAVLPELILENKDDGLKSVAYSELTAVLINAIKEQQEIIEDLKTRVQQLEN